MNPSSCTKKPALNLTAALLGPLVWLLATACGGQTQSSGAPQGSTAPTSLSTPGQSASPSTTGVAAGVAPAPAPANPAAASASPSSAPSKPAAASPSASPSASAGRWNFDADPVGGVPAGAQVFSGQWAVLAESDAPSPPNALCQTGQADFPAIGLDTRPYTDLTLVARFKPISGQEDQAGGLIFRVQDRDNYYIARANALEDNVIFFIYVGARRSQLKGAGAVAAPAATPVVHGLAD